MKVYQVTVIDKVASGADETPPTYESYIAEWGAGEYTEDDNKINELLAPYGLTDDDIHYYFGEGELEKGTRRVSTPDFDYIVGAELKNFDELDKVDWTVDEVEHDDFGDTFYKYWVRYYLGKSMVYEDYFENEPNDTQCYNTLLEAYKKGACRI